jgi:hypothetical protein
LEVDQGLAQWDLLEEHIAAADGQITQRAKGNANARLIATLYGTKPGYAALALAASIGPIARFPRPRSLANYWGLTPSCRNSGESGQRLTRAGRGSAGGSRPTGLQAAASAAGGHSGSTLGKGWDFGLCRLKISVHVVKRGSNPRRAGGHAYCCWGSDSWTTPPTWDKLDRGLNQRSVEVEPRDACANSPRT